MTQEEKQLLLVDLCARLPYKLIVHVVNVGDKSEYDSVINSDLLNAILCDSEYIGSCKPYLRSMSSMTNEERTEYFLLKHRDNDRDDNTILVDEASALIDWLNKHHFDYRGLIEKGLAIEVTKENNPYED